MTALGWTLIAVGPLVVVFAFPVANAQRRAASRVALTMAKTAICSVGFERRP